MLVCGHKCGCWKPTETSVFEFSYLCVNSSLEELIKFQVIFILSRAVIKSRGPGISPGYYERGPRLL